MPRRKPFPARPEKPFRIYTMQRRLDNVATHTRAGFAHIPEDIVRAHFYEYLKFLQSKGLTVRPLAASPADVTAATELWSHDLTLQGYRFVQYSGDKWVDRLDKFAASDREVPYLEKWYRQFLELPSDTFEAESGA